MGNTNKISTDVQDVWSKLNSRWQGEDANAFYRGYILRIAEIVDTFEESCSVLSDISSELMKELKSIEQSLAE